MQQIDTIPMLILDTETTGLDAEACVVELAAIGFPQGVFGPCIRYRVLVNPLKPIPKEVSELHGITDAMVSDAPTWAEVGPDINNMLGRWARAGILCVYNVPYDFGVIAYENERAGIEATPLVVEDAFDPLVGEKWYRRHVKSHRLSDTATRFGVQHVGAHSALGDCQATAEILQCLMSRGQLRGYVRDTLQRQNAQRQALDAERNAYGSFIYCDRGTPDTARLNNGELLTDKDQSHWRWRLQVHTDSCNAIVAGLKPKYPPLTPSAHDLVWNLANRNAFKLEDDVVSAVIAARDFVPGIPTDPNYERVCDA